MSLSTEASLRQGFIRGNMVVWCGLWNSWLLSQHILDLGRSLLVVCSKSNWLLAPRKVNIIQIDEISLHHTTTCLCTPNRPRFRIIKSTASSQLKEVRSLLIRVLCGGDWYKVTNS
jgi:hypothetical protein